MLENLDHILESLLFVAEEPLTVEKLKLILETVDTKEIRSALQSLAERYDARGGGFKLTEVAGGWQLRSRPEYNQWIKRMLQPPPQRLSRASLETLAIVAYNQPIIRADIEHIRGVDCGGVLRQLLERKLIRVLGRKEIPGRPLIYATTKLFLELFELKDLKDLPSPKEIEEMGAAVEAAEASQESEHHERPLFEFVDAPESASGEELPKMRFTLPRFTLPMDASSPTPHPTGRATVDGFNQRLKIPDVRNAGITIAIRRHPLPADRPTIGQSPHALPGPGVGPLPAAD
jgi:segregation and condensation protein B